MGAALLIAVQLIVLHRVDGGEVDINAEQITSLRSPHGMRESVPHGHCVIGLTDGKFVAVLEPCGKVRQQLEGR